LYLCKNLVELIGGDISLDDDYDSGIPDVPGTRFVVNLKVPPIGHSFEFSASGTEVDYSESSTAGTTTLASSCRDIEEANPIKLPEAVSVLFVDDDFILRKLFARSIKGVAPGWTVREAANGETALGLVDSEHFDLIFMDQYMASTHKQFLGTETVAALREKGVNSPICGLSANDTATEFMEAGADAFLMKPLPCNAYKLKQELSRLLNTNTNTKVGEVLHSNVLSNGERTATTAAAVARSA
jgi:CheY-like chemotaxis protein